MEAIHKRNQKKILMLFSEWNTSANIGAQISYNCDVWDKHYSHNSDFSQHPKKRTGEKPYQCKKCGKAFSLNFTFVQPQSIHSGTRPCVCEQWQGVAGQRPSPARQGIPPGLKSYWHEECGEAFSFSSSFIHHQRIYPEERPCVCRVCEAFRPSSHCTKHQ